jgi:sugar O-acyltransferase (sialic acid O-acetyltransferase NeuD family)
LDKKNKTLAIIGAGHLGQQIAHYAKSDGHYSEVVFFDDFSNQKSINGYEILGILKDIELNYSNHTFDELIVGIGYKHLEIRKQMYERFKNKIPFGKIVHSTCWVDETAKIESGTIVYPNCCIDANATIKNNTILNLACTIAHDTVVGEHCFLSPRVALAGFITVGEQCIIGINTTVIDNISIVPKTQLGGGTVLIKNIEKPGLYVGNPQKFIR